MAQPASPTGRCLRDRTSSFALPFGSLTRRDACHAVPLPASTPCWHSLLRRPQGRDTTARRTSGGLFTRRSASRSAAVSSPRPALPDADPQIRRRPVASAAFNRANVSGHGTSMAPLTREHCSLHLVRNSLAYFHDARRVIEISRDTLPTSSNRIEQ